MYDVEENLKHPSITEAGECLEQARHIFRLYRAWRIQKGDVDASDSLTYSLVEKWIQMFIVDLPTAIGTYHDDPNDKHLALLRDNILRFKEFARLDEVKTILRAANDLR